MKNIKLKITLLLFLAPFYSYSCLADLEVQIGSLK